MRNWVIALTLSVLVFCNFVKAELIDNPDSFERGDTILQIYPNPTDGWETWGSGSGSGGWCGGLDCGGRAEYIFGDSTDGDQCLQVVATDAAQYWGYILAFNHGTPIIPGEIYEYFFDYKSVVGSSGVFKLELYDAENNQLSVVAWDPFEVTIPNVWHHFSYTFRAPANAAFVTPVVGATGVGSIMRYDMLGILIVRRQLDDRLH
jgi:hypothetical protein